MYVKEMHTIENVLQEFQEINKQNCQNSHPKIADNLEVTLRQIYFK